MVRIYTVDKMSSQYVKVVGQVTDHVVEWDVGKDSTESLLLQGQGPRYLRVPEKHRISTVFGRHWESCSSSS